MPKLLEMDMGFIQKMPKKEFSVYYREAVYNLLHNANPPDSLEAYKAANRILCKTHERSLKRIRIREIYRTHDIKARLEEFNFAQKLYLFVRKITAEHLEKDGLIKKVS